ncbi:AAA family ATPase [Mycolicibacterium sp. CBM1]
MAHPAILVTGMSGVGKSSALIELAQCGFACVDTDADDWIRIVDDEPLWDEQRIDRLLRAPRRAALFVQGTVANQGTFYDRFEAIVLLSAPAAVLFERLATRQNNPFGKTPSHRRRIARDIADVEPLLRAAATHEIDTRQPLNQVVNTLQAIARDITAGQSRAASIPGSETPRP